MGFHSRIRDHYGVSWAAWDFVSLYDSRRETLGLKLQMAEKFHTEDLWGMCLWAQLERGHNALWLGEGLFQESGAVNTKVNWSTKAHCWENAASTFFLTGQWWVLYCPLHICPKTPHTHTPVTRQLGSRWARCFKLNAEPMRRAAMVWEGNLETGRGASFGELQPWYLWENSGVGWRKSSVHTHQWIDQVFSLPCFWFRTSVKSICIHVNTLPPGC